MLALTSKECSKAVSKYLLSFDLENWKIFSDNFYKMTPFESERILTEIAAKMDIHMILDLLSLAHIIGQSISLSNSLIKSFISTNTKSIDEQIRAKVKSLLNSPFAEERRTGLLMAGYFDMDEFFPIIEKMSNYDVLFEDAYFALGLFTDSKIVELLSTKFIYLGKNTIQRNAIAKILARKGNPLAALWLFKNKGLDESTITTKTIYLSRDLAWSGILPHLFLDSDDDFLQPVALKMINGLAFILPYDIEIIKEIELHCMIKKLISIQKEKPTIELFKASLAIKMAVDEIYFNIDPFAIDKETRNEIIKSWNLLEKYPNEKLKIFAEEFIQDNLNLSSPHLKIAIKLIRTFNLKNYEEKLLQFSKQKAIETEILFEIITTLGYIGTEVSAEYIIEKITEMIDFEKRTLLTDQMIQFHSDIDYFDDFDNEQLVMNGKTLEEDIIVWNQRDNEDMFYWNALFSLGKIKSEKALPILLNSLNDYDPKIRLEAISGLKAINCFNQIIEEKLIVSMLNEQFMSVQRKAILTLGSLNSQQAIPIFLGIIYKAIEEGILELADAMVENYDTRWDENETNTHSEHSNIEELGATQRVPRKMDTSQEKLVDEDINRWIKRFGETSQNSLELREDFNDQELDLTLESEVIEESTVSEYGTNDISLSEEMGDNEMKDDEWLSELGERFKKLTIVESVLEALKISNAKVSTDEIKELIEHPIDEELYKDALVILARTGESFAVNELLGLFDITDYSRSREIINALSNCDTTNLKRFQRKVNESPDWILKNTLKQIIKSKNNDS